MYAHYALYIHVLQISGFFPSSSSVYGRFTWFDRQTRNIQKKSSLSQVHTCFKNGVIITHFEIDLFVRVCVCVCVCDMCVAYCNTHIPFMFVLHDFCPPLATEVMSLDTSGPAVSSLTWKKKGDLRCHQNMGGRQTQELHGKRMEKACFYGGNSSMIENDPLKMQVWNWNPIINEGSSRRLIARSLCHILRYCSFVFVEMMGQTQHKWEYSPTMKWFPRMRQTQPWTIPLTGVMLHYRK